MDVPEGILNSAVAALLILTKARCAEGLQVKKDTRYKVLFSWPVHLEINPDVLPYMEEHGVLAEKAGVPAYPINYEQYISLQRVDTLLLEELEHLRSYLVANILLFYFPTEGLEISAFWDHIENPNTIAPASTSDCEALAKFSEGSDALYGFCSPKKSLAFKIPAKMGEKLFLCSEKFKGMPVQAKDYIESAGKSTDAKGRANRLIVQPSKLAGLEKVQTSTIKAIMKLIDSSELKYSPLNMQSHQSK
jgi:hypothetical protein